jgi:hypothetical protein
LRVAAIKLNIANIVERRYPFLNLVVGGKDLKVRWRQANEDFFLVDPHNELVPGVDISGSFQAKGGLGVFRFNGTVAGDENYEHRKFDFLRLDVNAGSVEQDQRREFSRAYFSPSLRAAMRLIGGRKKRSDFSVDIVNLSAAGAGILTRAPLDVGVEIILDFAIPLPDVSENINITAECVRNTEVDHPVYSYYAGVAFRFAGRCRPNEVARFQETQRFITRAVDKQNIEDAQKKV